jgi:hypothetical protein
MAEVGYYTLFLEKSKIIDGSLAEVTSNWSVMGNSNFRP